MLKTDFKDIDGVIPYRSLIYTGPVDEFFDHHYGKLPYRSLDFEHQVLNTEVAQPAPVINYPNEHSFTRITEFKYLTGQRHEKTALVYEYPKADGDPYYPIPRPENNELYKRYQALAEQFPEVHFVGRLATYRYYNMDQVVAQALTTFERIVGTRRKRGAPKADAQRFTPRVVGGDRVHLQSRPEPLLRSS
jgi:UDP-galactopyranose mutase